MPSRSDLPGEIKQRKLLRALRRCGFVIDASGGKGSHIKVTWPPTQKAVTVIRKTDKNVLRYLLKEIEEISGITWNDIRAQL